MSSYGLDFNKPSGFRFWDVFDIWIFLLSAAKTFHSQKKIPQFENHLRRQLIEQWEGIIFEQNPPSLN